MDQIEKKTINLFFLYFQTLDSAYFLHFGGKNNIFKIYCYHIQHQMDP